MKKLRIYDFQAQTTGENNFVNKSLSQLKWKNK